MYSFITMVMTDVDSYWTKVWLGAGYKAPYVKVTFPGTNESVFTPCPDPENPNGRMTNDNDAFYCDANDTIVISQIMAIKIWNGQVTANTDADAPR
ncbi:hypothetical protein StoSoilB5_23790 [Arthrobacter sp. StoSoilB5]|nr:hypothetical protein StoSoilB5_23790 [Arthrobacter sp. StoSoilB5]